MKAPENMQNLARGPRGAVAVASQANFFHQNERPGTGSRAGILGTSIDVLRSPLRATSRSGAEQQNGLLFNHLVGGDKQIRRDGEAEWPWRSSCRSLARISSGVGREVRSAY